jgi:hypothetical protein
MDVIIFSNSMVVGRSLLSVQELLIRGDHQWVIGNNVTLAKYNKMDT